MRNYLLGGIAALALLPASTTARADLIRFDNPNQSNAANANVQSFVDLGGQGFGSAPRVLTLQTAPIQTGSVGPDNSVDGLFFTGDAISNGENKGSAPTLGSLGWIAGSQIAVAYNSNQTGNSGITLLDLTLNLYDASNALQASFSTSGTIQYSEDDLDLQEGNGSGYFIYVLDGLQRAQFNLLAPQSNWRVGLSASLGCAGAESATCQPSNDGADSFLLVAAGTPVINPTCPDCPVGVPSPVAGAGIPGILAALFGLFGFHRYRRRKQEA